MSLPSIQSPLSPLFLLLIRLAAYLYRRPRPSSMELPQALRRCPNFKRMVTWNPQWSFPVAARKAIPSNQNLLNLLLIGLGEALAQPRAPPADAHHLAC